MTGKIKIALCLSGEPRDSMFCFPYIYESFINLGPKYEVDVYIHTRKTFRAFPLYNPTRYLLDDPYPSSVLEKYQYIKLSPKLEQEVNTLNHFTMNNNNIVNQLLMIDGIYKCFSLTKQSSKIYDIYIRCRPDLFTSTIFNTPSVINDILLKKYDMYIPSKNFDIDSLNHKISLKEYNDQFSIGNYKSMNIYSDLINNLDYLINNTDSLKAERWLRSQLIQSNINVYQFPFHLNLVRNVQIYSNKGQYNSPDLTFLNQ